MELTVNIDATELVESLVFSGDDAPDPLEFVLKLDEAIADEQFTLDLLVRLAETLESEYVAHEQYLAGRLLEKTFGAGGSSGQFVPSYPQPSDFDRATEVREKLSDVLKTLKSLL
jgi:hypothetical protein